jgi:hypothetical protein
MGEKWRDIKARVKVATNNLPLATNKKQDPSPETLLSQISHLPVEQLLAFQRELAALIEQKKEEIRDRRLEQEILYLAGRCDSANPLLLACDHPLAHNRREYELYYCNADYKDIGKKCVWDTTGAAHLDELAKKTEDVILRRTKQECLDLPPKMGSPCQNGRNLR